MERGVPARGRTRTLDTAESRGSCDDQRCAKLRTLGPALGYPHSSAVRGELGLRELRPRGGRSPWRALYRRIGDTFVVAAVGPEAQVDQRGFRRACAAAAARLVEIEEG